MKDFKGTESRYLILFLVISGFGITYFFLFMAFDKDFDAFRWLVMEHNYNWQFSDFFRQIVYASDLENIYFKTTDAPFPPLTYCFFHLLWLMNPIELPIELKSWRELSNYQFNLVIFLIIMIAQMIMLSFATKKILAQYGEKAICLFLFEIIFSAPFLAGAIERGNVALSVLILLLFALYYRDSDSKFIREVALIFIAVAASIKIYPAIFGLLYLRERRWKEVFRLMLYGTVLFFIPFVFTGGTVGLIQYIKNLISFAGGDYRRWTSIRCFFAASCQYLNWNIDAQMIGSWLEKLFIMISIVMVIIEGRNWKQLLFLSGIMTVYVPNSYRYTSIYMFLPLIFLLKELYQKRNGKAYINYLYIVLFSASFTIPVWANNREVDFAIFLPIYLILLVGMLETVSCFIKEQSAKAIKREHIENGNIL